MRFFPALCLGGLVAATPLGLGSLSADSLNPFSSNIEQLPLRVLHDFVEGTPFEALVPEEKGSSEDTTYDIISKDPNFSKLTKAIDFAEDAHHFKDRNARFTFFAVPDWALPRSLDGRCDLTGTDDLPDDEIASFTITQNCHVGDVVVAIEDIESMGDNGDGDKKERRTKFLKKLVHAILAYDCIRGTFEIHKFAENTTYPTELSIPGIFEDQWLRVRIDQQYSPPSTTINLNSQVVYPNIKTANGIIHVVNHPIFPQLSVLQTLFMLPDEFSILTSALQRVGLTDKVDFRYVRDHHDHPHVEYKGSFKGTSALTLFAPDNAAFERLPPKLKFFLFSPFGHHVLRKILEYHIVPGLVIHTDWQFNKSAHASLDDTFALGGHGERGHHGDVVLNLHLHLPTLLENRSIDTRIKKTEYAVPLPDPRKPIYMKSEFQVDGQHVAIRDAVANNGAMHLVPHLLDPRGHHHHGREGENFDNSKDSTWDDWEEWLPQWAASLEN